MPQLFSTKLSLERSDAIFGTENSSQFLSQTMNARFEFRPGQGLLQTQNSAPKQLTFHPPPGLQSFVPILMATLLSMMAA